MSRGSNTIASTDAPAKAAMSSPTAVSGGLVCHSRAISVRSGNAWLDCTADSCELMTVSFHVAVVNI